MHIAENTLIRKKSRTQPKRRTDERKTRTRLKAHNHARGKRVHGRKRTHTHTHAHTHTQSWTRQPEVHNYGRENRTRQKNRPMEEKTRIQSKSHIHERENGHPVGSRPLWKSKRTRSQKHTAMPCRTTKLSDMKTLNTNPEPRAEQKPQES